MQYEREVFYLHVSWPLVKMMKHCFVKRNILQCKWNIHQIWVMSVLGRHKAQMLSQKLFWYSKLSCHWICMKSPFEKTWYNAIEIKLVLHSVVSTHMMRSQSPLVTPIKMVSSSHILVHSLWQRDHRAGIHNSVSRGNDTCLMDQGYL